MPWAFSALGTLGVESTALKLRFNGEPERVSLSFSALCFRVSGEQSSIISVWTLANARIFSPRSFKLAVSQAVTIPLAISATRTRKRWEDSWGDPWRSCSTALCTPAMLASEAQTLTAESGTALFKGISERFRRALLLTLLPADVERPDAVPRKALRCECGRT